MGIYIFYVIALFESIPSIQSNPVFVTIIPPLTPGLSVTTTCNVAALDWTPVSPPSCTLTYQVYQDSGSGFNIIATTTQTTLNINLDAVDTYSFYVIAVLGSISSASSNTVYVTIEPTPVPTLSVTTNCNVATLNWNINPDCFSTMYQIWQNDGFGNTLVTTVNTTPFDVTIDTNRLYDFFIIEIIGSIASAPSNIVPVTITQDPLFLTITLDCNMATLNWNINLVCNSLTYQIWQTVGFVTILVNTVNTTTYDVTLNEGDLYEFYIIELLDGIVFDQSNTVPITFNEFLTNGSKSSFINPLSDGSTLTDYTYILFNTIGSFYFTYNCDNIELYYMIVGPGGTGQSGFTGSYYSIGGDGGGAGGIWNGVIILPQGNYTITIPGLNNSTIIEDSVTPTIFNITATTGSFAIRGGVTQTLNSITTTLSSSTPTPPDTTGIGGQPSEVTQVSASSGGPFVYTPGTNGGSVFKSGSSNYINFVGDGILSNKLFGGGGGGGGTGGNDIGFFYPANPATTGYNGGGGGGGGGLGLNGGTGLNGSNGTNGGTTGGTGGSAFTSSQGYGGGGGGGGSILPSGGAPRGPGGTGGPAMLMIYFIKQY